MTLHKYSGNEDLIAHKAFLFIQNDFYSSSGGNIPDFLPFKKPEVFDINKKNYSDPVLTMIVAAVRSVCLETLQRQNPDQHILSMCCPSQELERISWKVFALLRLAPLRTTDSTGNTILRHDLFRLADNYGEEGHLDMTHNRIERVNNQWIQQHQEKLQNALLDMLNKRYKLLENLFSVQQHKEQEDIMAYLERCSEEIQAVKRDIHALCDQHKLPNQLLQPDEEEESSFSGAVHWNYHQKQEKARVDFIPSETEAQLLPFLSQNFQAEEWPLFNFTFVPVEEIEKHGMSESGVFREDVRLLRERCLERKMLIGYFILHQLTLHRRNNLHISSEHFLFLEEKLDILCQEIDLLRRMLLNKAGHAHRIKNTLSEIDTLIISMQNALQIPCLNRALSRIMEGAMEIMHTFYFNCNTIYEDDLTDPLEVEGLIDNLRLDALEKIREYESAIIDIKTSSSFPDESDFDRIVNTLHQVLSFLKGEK